MRPTRLSQAHSTRSKPRLLSLGPGASYLRTRLLLFIVHFLPKLGYSLVPQTPPLSRSTLASITCHYASSAYPCRDYKFGQILSQFLSFALPFADTNDHHGTIPYIS